MATINQLMTVEQFRNLPEDDGPVYHELRNGEVVEVTRPKSRHMRIQKRLEKLLEPLVGDRGVVVMEMAFRPLPEYELRVADVAYVTNERWSSIDPEDYLQGAPDLVIEVLSASNTASEIFDKEELCLGNGAREFWVVDPVRRTVKVSTADGHTVTYRSGLRIHLPTFGEDAGLDVDSIFQG